MDVAGSPGTLMGEKAVLHGEKICKNCNKPNHFASVCQSTNIATIHEEYNEPTELNLSTITAPL